MKIIPDPIRTFFTYLAMGLVSAVIFFLLFGYPYYPFRLIQVPIAITPLIVALIFALVTLRTNYYILERKKIIQHKFHKELVYYYNEIIYVDFEYTKRHHIVRLYTNKGHERFLPMDKKGLLYESMRQHCSNIISFAELKKRFPKARV